MVVDAVQEVSQQPFEVDHVVATIGHAAKQKTAANCRLAARLFTSWIQLDIVAGHTFIPLDQVVATINLMCKRRC